MSSITGETRIRSIAASLILGREELLIVRQSQVGFELAGLDGAGTVFCEDWPHTERVLLSLGVPFHQVDEIEALLIPGTDIIVRRTISG